MAEIVQWNDIKERYHQGALLLGNGASIAVNSCFDYKSLFQRAVDLGYLTPNVQAVFDKFGVDDFELVLRRLWQAKLVNEALDIPRGEVEIAYEEVRQALITTVRATHVSFDDAKSHLDPIYTFMQKFDFVISLNYDLIVYWAMLRGNDDLGLWFKDGFTPSKFKSDWKTLKKAYKSEGATLCFYPHGNLILRREGFSSECKIQAATGNLLDTILLKWEEENLVPAFVCEGLEQNKREAISSLNYFEKVFYEVLPNLPDTLVVYGWRFGDQDQHIIDQIAKSDVKRVAVAIYANDQVLCGNVERKLKEFPLEELKFFDAQSEGCWNKPSVEIVIEEGIPLLKSGEKLVSVVKLPRL